MRGSITQRSPGSYRIQWYCGKNEQGKAKYHNKTIKGTKKQAQTALNQILADLQRGTHVEPAKIKTGEWIRLCLSDYIVGTVSERTLQGYNEIAEKHLYTAFENLNLCDVQASHIQKYYTDKLADGGRVDGKEGGLSPVTVCHHHALLSRIFRLAVYHDKIVRNPMLKVTPPRAPEQERDAFTEAELKKLLAYCRERKQGKEHGRYDIPILIAAYTGLRLSEVLALRWQDISVARKTVSVQQVIDHTTTGGLKLKEPKTKKSRRTIPVHPMLFRRLAPWRRELRGKIARLGEAWQGDGTLICPDDLGRLRNPSTASSMIIKLIKDSGVRQLGMHALRHTYATHKLHQGVNLRALQDLLGHSVVNTTARYTHVSDGYLSGIINGIINSPE